MAAQRHKDTHIPEALLKAQEAQEAAHGDDLLSEARALMGKAQSLLSKAEDTGDYRTALSGVREARGCLELLAKLMGKLDDRPQVNILLNPTWVSVRAVLMGALSEFPSARAVVAQRLAELEGQGG